MFMALVTSLVVFFYCCVTADILTKLLQQCFLIFIVVPWLYLGNSQVSVYRTIGPTLVYSGRIRTLVAMATYSSHRLIMGKVEIDNICQVIGDI